MRNGIDQPYTGLTEDQYHDLNIKLYDLIQSLEYKVDSPDLINALCYEFATGYKVFQKNWDWFVADFHGNAKDFADGFELAIS